MWGWNCYFLTPKSPPTTLINIEVTRDQGGNCNLYTVTVLAIVPRDRTSQKSAWLLCKFGNKAPPTTRVSSEVARAFSQRKLQFHLGFEQKSIMVSRIVHPGRSHWCCLFRVTEGSVPCEHDLFYWAGDYGTYWASMISTPGQQSICLGGFYTHRLVSCLDLKNCTMWLMESDARVFTVFKLQ